MYVCNLSFNLSHTAVVRAQTISLDELEEGYVFPDLGEIEGVLFPNGSSASISLPQQLLSSRGMGQLNSLKLRALTSLTDTLYTYVAFNCIIIMYIRYIY